MFCVICKNLELAFKSREHEYIETRSSASYRVSTMFAARKNVDMERAKYELEEHQRGCASAVKAALRLLQQNAAATLAYVAAKNKVDSVLPPHPVLP
jgi:outer membrane translocation and assembly module TamA